MDEREQQLFVSIDDNIPSAFIGDDHRLSQVITNLLSNSAKFTPDEGEIYFEARLLSKKDGMSRIQISVQDTGIGISNEQKENLFKAFKQADTGTTRKYGGTGLGLAISKRIVELMDGDIWVESQLNKGSKFIFTVLLKHGNTTIRRYGKGINTGTIDLNELQNLIFADQCVLLAEDIEINREIALTLLEPTGLCIECAENGAQAVEMFASAPEKYSLILMDVQMPEMDGYRATRAIRQFEADNGFRNIPILAMTANVFREDVEKCLESGMNGHIGKPIDVDELMRKLKKYLKK
jgi:CheY-like chemotaxis protein/anti-sigma regulatory factor (Ser/Thr protein kinase)